MILYQLCSDWNNYDVTYDVYIVYMHQLIYVNNIWFVEPVGSCHAAGFFSTYFTLTKVQDLIHQDLLFFYNLRPGEVFLDWFFSYLGMIIVVYWIKYELACEP